MYANMSDHIHVNVIKGSVEVKRPTDVTLQQVVPRKRCQSKRDVKMCVRDYYSLLSTSLDLIIFPTKHSIPPLLTPESPKIMCFFQWFCDMVES